MHTTRPRGSGGLRTGRLHGHTAPLDPDGIRWVADVAVTSPARTLADIARTEGFEQAVVIVDAGGWRADGGGPGWVGRAG